MKCQRGDIWWVALDPAIGSEAKKTRPAVVVSSDESNRSKSIVQVVPCTSKKTDRVYSFEALVTIDGGVSKAQADQIRTVSTSRLKEMIGAVSSAEMEAIERAIRIQLGI